MMRYYRRAIGVSVLFAIMAGFIISTDLSSEASAAVQKCSSTTPVTHRPLLRKGDTGSCVKELQKRLVVHGYSVGAAGVDGDFGSSTLTAVKKFQSAKKLSADGLVGQKTWSALVAKKSAPAPSTTYNKYTCGNVGKKVFLVYDDYPTSKTAFKKLIDTAKKNKIGIGVAPNGTYVKSGRAPVQYARDKGMLVVDHTYSHKNLTKLSKKDIIWEITRPYVNSNYVRPPFGAENATVRSVLAQYGKYDCLWTLDPRDWDGRSPQKAADYIIKNAKPGSTAVVHMNHLGTKPELLVTIKKGLQKRGIAMCAPWSKPTTPHMPPVYCD